MEGGGGSQASVTPEAYMALTTSSYGATSEYMKDDRGRLQPTTEPILEAATKFLWDDMKETLEAFCRNHAELFAGVAPLGGASRDRVGEMALRDALGVGPAAGPLGDATGGGLGAFRSVKAPEVEGEQRLEWTECHNEYLQLFEHVLESFLEMQPFSAEDFVAACQDALDCGSWANCRRMAEAILAMPDYNNFVRMMTEAAQQLEAEAARAEGPGMAPEPEVGADGEGYEYASMAQTLLDDEGGAE